MDVKPPKVFAWTADFTGCGYYRTGLPMYGLRGIGWDAEASNKMLDEYVVGASVIIGQRVSLPGPSQRWQSMVETGLWRTIYEVDDDFFHVDRSNVGAYDYYGKPQILENIRLNAAAADMVTVTTEPLAEVMRQFNDNVVVIPNFIDEKFLDYESTSDPEFVNVGWAGSTTHFMDFKDTNRMLRKAAERLPETRFVFAGGDYGMNAFPEGRYKHLPYQFILEDHFMNVSQFDIGLAPLKRHVFNDSKSWIKALEYGALGLPMIASNVTPYRAFVKDKETGFLVRQEYDWIKYITALVKDEDMRKEMGAAAKALAAENTIQKNVNLWADAINSLL